LESQCDAQNPSCLATCHANLRVHACIACIAACARRQGLEEVKGPHKTQ
jgi:hypothetical protein